MQKLFKRMSSKARNILCTVLVVAFLIDVAYSVNKPNIGAGITDDGQNNEIIQEIIEETK